MPFTNLYHFSFMLRDLCVFREVLPTIESVTEIIQCEHSSEKYFPMVLFIMLYKMVLV